MESKQNRSGRPSLEPTLRLAPRDRDLVPAAQLEALSDYHAVAYERLHRQAMSIVGSPEAAEDVVQEAFARTARAIARGTDIRNLGAWLNRCVRNLAVNHLHERDTLPLHDNFVPPDTQSLPDIAYVRERFREISEVLDELTPAQRSAFLLAEVHGLSYREIGSTIGRSVEGVRQLLSRARTLVRDAVGPETFALIPALLTKGSTIDNSIGEAPAHALTELAPRSRFGALQDRVSETVNGLRAKVHTLAEGSHDLVSLAAQPALPVFAILLAVSLSAPTNEEFAGAKPGGDQLQPTNVATVTATPDAGPRSNLVKTTATEQPQSASPPAVPPSGNGGRPSPQSDAEASLPREQSGADGDTQVAGAAMAEAAESPSGSATSGASPRSSPAQPATSHERTAYVTGLDLTWGAPVRGVVTALKIDTDTNTIADAPAPVTGMDISQPATGVAFTPDGENTYVTVLSTNRADGNQNHLAMVRTATDTVERWIKVASDPITVTVAPDNSRAYVAYDAGSAYGTWVLGAPTGSVHATLSLGSHPYGVAITPDSSRVYLAHRGGAVKVFDNTAPNPRNAVASIPVARPYALAITPDGRRIYVTNTYEHRITVIDSDPASATYNTVARTIDLAGGTPGGIAITPDGSRAYVTDVLLGRLYVIGIDPANPATDNQLVDTVSVGTPANTLAIAPNGKRAYVTNPVHNKIAVIDTGLGSSTYNRQVDSTSGLAPRSSDIAIVPNQGPSLDQVTATPASAGQPTTLVAQGASDSDGYVASYRWDFGDGSPVVTTDEPTTTHTYASPGIYTAEALPVDSEDGWGKEVKTDGRHIYYNPSNAPGKEVSIPVGPATTPSQGGGGGLGSTTGSSPGDQNAAAEDCVSLLKDPYPSVTHWKWTGASMASTAVRLKVPVGFVSPDKPARFILQTRRAGWRGAVKRVDFRLDGKRERGDSTHPYAVGIEPGRLALGRHRLKASVLSRGNGVRTLARTFLVSRCVVPTFSSSMINKMPGKRTDLELRIGADRIGPNENPTILGAAFKLPPNLRVRTRGIEGSTPIGRLQLLDGSRIKSTQALRLQATAPGKIELARDDTGLKATLARRRSGYEISLAELGDGVTGIRLAFFGRRTGLLANASSCQRYVYSAVLTTTDGQSVKLKRGLTMCKGRRGAA